MRFFYGKKRTLRRRASSRKGGARKRTSRHRQIGGGNVQISAKDLITASQLKSDASYDGFHNLENASHTGTYDELKVFINTYFVGKWITITKKDTSKISGYLSMKDVNMSGDTIELIVTDTSDKKTTLPFEALYDVIDTIIIKDVEQAAPSGYRIINSSTLRPYIKMV